MKKLLIIFIALMAISGVMQKIIGDKNIFRSMSTTMQKDDDPNSSTKRLAKENRELSAKMAAEKKQHQSGLNTELERRLEALGETSAKLGTNEALIYLFNDSGRDAIFSVERKDGTKYAPDLHVAAGRYEKLLVKEFYRAYVGVNGKSGKWVVGTDIQPEMGFANVFGCFYK